MMASGRRGGSLRRIRALVRKEALQILRDPSSIVVAFVLPVLLLFLVLQKHYMKGLLMGSVK